MRISLLRLGISNANRGLVELEGGKREHSGVKAGEELLFLWGYLTAASRDGLMVWGGKRHRGSYGVVRGAG